MVHRAASLAPVLAALVLACTPSEPQGSRGPVTSPDSAAPQPTPEPAPADARDMLIVGVSSDVHTLLPVVSQTELESRAMSQIYYEGIQADFDCSLKFRPGVVESWSWGEDSKSLTLTLRSDITWADGAPVTARDFAFAFEVIGDPKVRSPRIGYFEALSSPPEVLSPTEIRFNYSEPGDRYTRLSQATSYYLPHHLLGEIDREALRGHPIAKSPVPTGPFKLEEHKPGQSLTLVPNSAFSGPVQDRARLKRVQFKVIPEYQPRLLKLKRGEIDFMDSLRVKDADELRASNENLRIERRGYRFMDYVAWNLNDDRFKDKEVRRAMAHAVDVDGMISRLLKSESGETYAQQAVSSISPELCAVRAKVDPIKRNLEQAQQMLADAGWTDTDGDGIVDKGGVKLAFTMLVDRGNERRSEAAQLIQNDLKAIGVQVDLETLEYNAMSERLKKKKFQAAMGGWAASLFIDPSAMWHSDEKHLFNFPSYSNPKVDELIERGLRTPDPAEAAPIWREMQEIIYEDQPYLFLWWRDDIVAIDSRFQDTSIDILSPLNDLHRWHVPEDKVKYNF